jgi:hypothetical protein
MEVGAPPRPVMRSSAPKTLELPATCLNFPYSASVERFVGTVRSNVSIAFQ